MDTDPITVLGIAGSLREGSCNRAQLRSAQSSTPDGMRREIFDCATRGSRAEQERP